MRPAQGYAKLNVDGSSLGNLGRSGGGGMLRDVNEHMTFVFVNSMPKDLCEGPRDLTAQGRVRTPGNGEAVVQRGISPVGGGAGVHSEKALEV